MSIGVTIEGDFPSPREPGRPVLRLEGIQAVRRPGRPRGVKKLPTKPDHEPTVARVAMALAWNRIASEDRALCIDEAEALLRDLQAIL